MRTNVAPVNTRVTHEGAPASAISPEQELRRSLMACMLWEGTFYESGVEIAERIASLVPKVPADRVASMAIEAREKMHLRHAPLWLVRSMLASPSHKSLVRKTLARVIQRADEMGEFLALLWGGKGEGKLPSSVKKGLAEAFGKFDAYRLAKYNRDAAVTLRDVLFLCHAKPRDDAQAALWKSLLDGTLASPDTWEVALSAGADKKLTWERLISENKLGGLAMLRNLRNMQEVGVEPQWIRAGLQQMNASRVLPFRFIAAAKYAPQCEPDLEAAFFRAFGGRPKFHGPTGILVDVSGSMTEKLSEKSVLSRMDAACGVALCAREMCDDARIYSFSNGTVLIPPRRGFALRDAIIGSQPNGGTYLGQAVTAVLQHAPGLQRLIVVSDEQAHDRLPVAMGLAAYMVNVAPYRNGVGYGHWFHIDGWSDAVLDYIAAAEGLVAPESSDEDA